MILAAYDSTALITMVIAVASALGAISTVILNRKARSGDIWKDNYEAEKERNDILTERIEHLDKESTQRGIKIDTLSVQIEQLKERDQQAVLRKLDDVASLLGARIDNHEKQAAGRGTAIKSEQGKANKKLDEAVSHLKELVDVTRGRGTP